MKWDETPVITGVDISTHLQQVFYNILPSKTCCEVQGRRLSAGHVLGIHVRGVHQPLHPGHVPIPTGLEQLPQGPTHGWDPRAEARRPGSQSCRGANSGRLGTLR